MESIQSLKRQNEQLKAQLLNTSLIHELTKVLHSCTDLKDIIKTLLLALQEIINFDRVILFTIDREHFRLKPNASVGIKENELSELSIPLGFTGGEITDALFLNRHILVEQPDKNDPCHLLLGSEAYLTIPLINKINKKCWEMKSCTKTACPAHGGYNPYCWSIKGSGLLINAKNEDERRAACIVCPCFKFEGVLWMDRNVRKIPITSDDITIVTASVTMAGIVIENFRIFDALEKANLSEKKINNKLKIINSELQVAYARINRDLDHARTIQRGLLPQDLEDTPQFKVGTYYLSADAVGGDYYDVFNIEPGIYGLVVADVSGHGVASALIMSMGKILLKTFSRHEHSPQKT
ncbi:MAG: SpoIIE family protein phosphatase, partial [Chitinispirillaceae bacterium]|nr:SpoIIE family protein phosphatase [Chitinispirillaceae bacterium]